MNDDDDDHHHHQQGTTLRRVVSDAEISLATEEGGPSREYRVRKSSLIGMIDWTHVIGTNAPQLMAIGIVLLLAQIVHQVVTDLLVQEWNAETLKQVIAAVRELFAMCYARWMQAALHNSPLDLFAPYVKMTALILLLGAWIMTRQKPVYLMSFATFQAPASWKVSHDQLMQIMARQGCFSEQSMQFMQRILERSGTGQATAWPPGIVQCLQNENTPADRSIQASRQEAETVIFDVVQAALDKAGVSPRDIDVLIINCSLFSPTPSLCAMVLSHFNMRSDVATYNLSGMGCSASLISVDLAQQLLMTNKYHRALVVSTEILTPNFYHGNDRGFLIQNTLFRCGGAALVLSNRWRDGRHAWYKLLHTVRVQGTGQAAYECVYEGEDENGEKGVRLSKDIVKVAGKCMEKNFTMLGPQVLPWSEQAMVVASIAIRWIQQRVLNHKEPMKIYVPDFKTAIDHFCIHAGGRAVIDGIEKNLKLEPYHTEASRMTLLNYGNTSSSSIWYELEYIQEQQKTNPLRKGDRVLQVAFGSGFKCTSGVWLKL
jgi:3-ketoacyl-CoA synthase